MDTKVPDGPNARFKSGDVARTAFLDAAAADLAANAADITLLIDHRGVVRDAAFPGEEFEAADLNTGSAESGRIWSRTTPRIRFTP
jgi:hypothetical protein